MLNAFKNQHQTLTAKTVCLVLGVFVSGAGWADPVHPVGQINGEAHFKQPHVFVPYLDIENKTATLSSQIKTAVLDHVNEKLDKLFKNQSTTGDDRQIEILTLPLAGLDLDATGNFSIQTDSNLDQQFSERAVIRVNVENLTTHTRRSVGVPVKISVNRLVWVAKNSVTAKQPLKPSDFALEKRNISHDLGHSMGPERSLDGYLARISMMPGTVLDDRQVVIPPDIQYNDDISIIISSTTGMNLTVPGIAMAEGRIGDTIRVKQQVFKTRYYSAKIIDKNKVLVEI